MKKSLIAFIAVFLFFSVTSHAFSEYAEITKMGDYYNVRVDLSDSSVSRKKIGEDIGKAIVEAAPSIAVLLDNYVLELCAGNSTVYNVMLARKASILPNVPQILQDEVNGMALHLCQAETDVMGDGRLSLGELWILNLIGDVTREHQCSGFGVLPAGSATGHTLVGRNLDWNDGSTFQLSQLQAVMHYTLPDDRSLTLVGYLGLAVCISGFKENGVFAAILDSDTGLPYTAVNKRSYSMDLRLAMEGKEYDTIDKVAAFLQERSTQYAFSFNILFADRTSVQVLENDLQPGAARLRTADSAPLYLDWGIPNSLAVVNCFQLSTSINNTNDPHELSRWKTFRRMLREYVPKVSWADAEAIMGYGPGQGKDGFIYVVQPASGVQTSQSIIFEPATLALSVAFHPVGRSIGSGEKPKYTNITLTSPSSSGGCQVNPDAGFGPEAGLVLLALAVGALVRLRRSRARRYAGRRPLE